MDEIIELRNKIDIIDDQIMALLEERYVLSRNIGLMKAKSNHRVLDTNRENEILNKASKYSHFPQITEVYNSIFTQSKNLQKR